MYISNSEKGTVITAGMAAATEVGRDAFGLIL
jgi:hypothetical protein